MTLDLLSVLDAGEPLTLPERAVLLAEHAPGSARVPLEPVGRTTARLLALFEQLHGPLLEGTAPCRGCGATIEFSVRTVDLAAAAPGQAQDPDRDQAQEREWDTLAGVRWRPVSYDDLVLASHAADDASAVEMVLDRCVERNDVGADLRAQLADAMAQADPLAEIELDLRCPECDGAVRAVLDVIEFTWAQVVGQARTLLHEIDALARAYSWSEAEILALPTSRRRRFVDLVTGESP